MITTEPKQKRKGKKRKLYKPDQEELYELYYLQEKSLSQMAQLYNVTTAVIRGWMNSYNMPRRKAGQAAALYYRNRDKCPICEQRVTGASIHTCWGGP